MYELAIEYNTALAVGCYVVLALLAVWIFGGVARFGRGADLKTGVDLPPLARPARERRVRKH